MYTPPCRGDFPKRVDEEDQVDDEESVIHATQFNAVLKNIEIIAVIPCTTHRRCRRRTHNMIVQPLNSPVASRLSALILYPEFGVSTLD